jgi:hypothetical protein
VLLTFTLHVPSSADDGYIDKRWSVEDVGDWLHRACAFYDLGLDILPPAYIGIVAKISSLDYKIQSLDKIGQFPVLRKGKLPPIASVRRLSRKYFGDFRLGLISSSILPLVFPSRTP